MTKGTWILIGILVALIIVTYLVMQRTGEMNTSATRDTMLVKFDSAAVRRIAVHGRAGTVVLEREGSTWVMVDGVDESGERGNFPCRFSGNPICALERPRGFGLFHHREAVRIGRGRQSRFLCAEGGLP
jgi:hypothetical protein